MNRDHALSTLRRHADDLRRLGATRLFLFGSTARDEARSDSDVDLFVDFDDPGFSVVELVALKERIGELLSRPPMSPRAAACTLVFGRRSRARRCKYFKDVRSTRILLGDIVEAIQGIDQALAGADFAGFEQSWVMQRAVERGLEIVSEASRSLDAGQKAASPEVAWAQIAGIGNVLRHEYHRVEPLIIWNITLEHLPRLKCAIEAMITDEQE